MDKENQRLAVAQRMEGVNRELNAALAHLRRASGMLDQLDLFVSGFGGSLADFKDSCEVRNQLSVTERYMSALYREVAKDG